MKNAFRLLSFLAMILAFPYEGKPAISTPTTHVAAVQVSINEIGSEREKVHRKANRRQLKQWIKAALTNEAAISFGGMALLLVLSSGLVFLFMPSFAMLGVAFYVAAIFLGVLGIGRDKSKVAAIAALTICLLPLLLFAAFFISCEISGNCFD